MTKVKIYKDILEAIGNTPIVRLARITHGLKAEIYAKLEFCNPIGSVKDRIAKYMIEKAEKEGKIKPGTTIIENSSGNTALALAGVCALKGYKSKIIIRDNLSREKVRFLEAMNVDLVRVDHTIPPDSPNSYNNLALKIAAETPGSYYLDQHNNRDNNETHYLTTGPEIWEQMEGRIDYFIAGIGTGGTICGAAQYLREKDPNIKVIAVDPVGSVFYDYFYKKSATPQPSPYLIEGLGDEFLIGCADFSVINEMVKVTDNDAFLTARKLAVIESIMAGGSSGAALWATMEIARKIDYRARIITIFPDSANRYLSNIFNDAWLQEKGFI